jgi:Domain of unknown function (DUF4915)/Berberine and berberine like
MALAIKGQKLVLVTRYQVLLFANAPLLACNYLETQTERYDALYLPRVAYFTGDLQIHGVIYAEDLWILNTLFSCISSPSTDVNFVPRWKPPFISTIVPEDRCHLSGMAAVSDKPRYVTALGETDTAEGWQSAKASGGVIVDVYNDEIVCRGLSMPHSPRWLGDANSSMFGFAVCYCGEIGRGEKLLKPLRSLGNSLSDSIRPMTYLEMQAVLGTYFPPEPPLSFYVKSGFLNELSDAAIEALVERALNPPPTPWMSFVEHFQGAAARADKATCAFLHRVRGFDVETAASWQDRQFAASATMWVRSVAEALHPYSEGGVYVNRLGDEGEERVQAAYGANYERLVALKNKYDPTNFFHLNQNIKPTGECLAGRTKPFWVRA